MAGRNTQVARIYTILNLLDQAPQGLTASTIWEKMVEAGHECEKRTIYRDIEALHAAGYPLIERGQDDANGLRWALDRSAKINQYLTLNSRELLALYLARAGVSGMKDAPFFSDLQSAFQRIEEKLGTKHQEFYRSLADDVRVSPEAPLAKGLSPEIVETLQAACSERHVLEVVYASANSQTERLRRLGPHYLYFARGSLYLVAEDLEASKAKVFSVPRMKSVTMTSTPYEGNAINPDDFFASSFGVYHGQKPLDIKLAFSKKLATYISERQWHRSQTIQPSPDGRLEMTLTVSLTPEFLQWVLGFGSDAEVLSPPEARERLSEEIERMKSVYS